MSPAQSYRVVKTTLATSAILAAVVTLAGCKDLVQSSGEDNDFIHQPGIDSVSATTQTGPLMPTKSGSVWRNQIRIQRTSGFSSSDQNPDIDSSGQPFRTLYEKVIALQIAPAVGGGTNLLFEVLPEKPNIWRRTELYQLNKKGIFFSRLTGEQALEVTPPIPLIRLPIQENQITKWSGTLKLRQKTYPAQGYSRVGSLEEIDAKSKIKARRVDTVIIAAINGRQTGSLMSRWFQPGVGIVRQRYFVNNFKVWAELVTYKP